MAANKKPLTKREKALNARIKKELQEEGRREYTIGEYIDEVVLPIIKL